MQFGVVSTNTSVTEKGKDAPGLPLGSLSRMKYDMWLPALSHQHGFDQRGKNSRGSLTCGWRESRKFGRTVANILCSDDD